MKWLPSCGENARYGEHGQDLAFKDLMSIPDIIAFLASSLLPEYGNETVEEVRKRIDSGKRYSAKRYATELKRPASTGLLDSAIRMSVPGGAGGRNYSKISSATGIWVLTKPPAHFRNMVDGLEFARIYPDEPGFGFTPKDLRRMRMFFVGLDGNGKEVSRGREAEGNRNPELPLHADRRRRVWKDCEGSVPDRRPKAGETSEGGACEIRGYG